VRSTEAEGTYFTITLPSEARQQSFSRLKLAGEPPARAV